LHRPMNRSLKSKKPDNSRGNSSRGGERIPNPELDILVWCQPQSQEPIMNLFPEDLRSGRKNGNGRLPFWRCSGISVTHSVEGGWKRGPRSLDCRRKGLVYLLVTSCRQPGQGTERGTPRGHSGRKHHRRKPMLQTAIQTPENRSGGWNLITHQATDHH